MVRRITKYVCEHCDKEYNTEQEAKMCCDTTSITEYLNKQISDIKIPTIVDDIESYLKARYSIYKLNSLENKFFAIGDIKTTKQIEHTVINLKSLCEQYITDFAYQIFDKLDKEIPIFNKTVEINGVKLQVFNSKEFLEEYLSENYPYDYSALAFFNTEEE